MNPVAVYNKSGVRPSDAFRRATSKKRSVKTKESTTVNYFAKEIISNKAKVVRHIVAETVDSKAPTLAYEPIAAIISYSKDTHTFNSISFDNVAMEMLGEIVKNFGRKNERIVTYSKTFLNTQTIDNFLRKHGFSLPAKNDREELKNGILVELPLQKTLPSTPIFLVLRQGIREDVKQVVINTTKKLFDQMSG